MIDVLYDSHVRARNTHVPVAVIERHVSRRAVTIDQLDARRVHSLRFDVLQGPVAAQVLANGGDELCRCACVVRCCGDVVADATEGLADAGGVGGGELNGGGGVAGEVNGDTADY